MPSKLAIDGVPLTDLEHSLVMAALLDAKDRQANLLRQAETDPHIQVNYDLVLDLISRISGIDIRQHQRLEQFQRFANAPFRRRTPKRP